MPKQSPPQQPPPVMRVLVRYGKVGPMRFASHRDLARAFERGLRRAEIPMSYSSGFSPHQRLSYVNPAPTGTQSSAELLVLALAERVDPCDVRVRLDSAMPNGVPILEVVETQRDVRPEASLWEVELFAGDDNALAAAVHAFHDADRVEVSRETKNGLRTFDVKAPVESLRVGISMPAMGDDLKGEGSPHPVFTLVIRHTEPLVRPDDVVSALASFEPTLGEALSTRVAQGPLAEFMERAGG